MATESRKRKRGKYQNRLVEDDDEAIDIVSFKEVNTNTPGGPVTKRVQIPLRPNVTLRKSTDCPRESSSNLQFEAFEDAQMDIDTPDDEQQANETPVCKVFYRKILKFNFLINIVAECVFARVHPSC
jgi:hypothetical protein